MIRWYISMLLCCIWTTFVWPQQPATFTLEGHIEPVAGWLPMLYVSRLHDCNLLFAGSSSIVTDSVALGADGHFRLQWSEALTERTFFRLNVQPEQSANPGGMIRGLPTDNYLFVALGPGSEAVRLHARADALTQTYRVVEGSDDNRQLAELRDRSWFISEIGRVGSRQLEEAKARGDQAAVDRVYTKFSKILLDTLLVYAPTMQAYALSSPHLLPALMAVKLANFDEDPRNDVAFLTKFIETWQPKAPGSRYLEQVKKQLGAATEGLREGDPAPEFQAVHLKKGSKLQVGAFRGKLLLLDFWASWCGPCRLENRTTVRPMYEKYGAKGLEVWSISLDKDEKAWRNAVKKDDLAWHHSLAPGAFESEAARRYSVRSVPTTYLVDANGVILARNLRGEMLVRFLERYFEER